MKDVMLFSQSSSVTESKYVNTQQLLVGFLILALALTNTEIVWPSRFVRRLLLITGAGLLQVKIRAHNGKDGLVVGYAEDDGGNHWNDDSRNDRRKGGMKITRTER